MIAKPNGRVCIMVRMSPEDKERIVRAAKRERMNLTTYMLRAGLMMAKVKQGPIAPNLTQDGQDALTALEQTGMTTKEAQAKVDAALAENPQASADEIVSAAFGAKQ